jgi:hypothetical protein
MTRREVPGRLLRTATPGVSQTIRVFAVHERFNLKGEPMELQQFSPAACSPDASYYSPADEAEDDRDPWQDYCFEASKVSRERILECVLSSLDTDDSPIYALIDSALKDPHEPGRARESITILAQIGQAILDRVASAVDDQVNLRVAGRVA